MRCENCNSELSQCGFEGVDGEPSWDCQLCKARDKITKLESENTVLKGLLPALGKPCVYCGLEDIGKCKIGFPGCAQADDIMAADDELCARVLNEDKAQKELILSLREEIQNLKHNTKLLS